MVMLGIFCAGLALLAIRWRQQCLGIVGLAMGYLVLMGLTSTLSAAIRLFISSLLIIGAGTTAITIFEGRYMGTPDPTFNYLKVLFETVSGYGTVGLSMGFDGCVTSPRGHPHGRLQDRARARDAHRAHGPAHHPQPVPVAR